MKAKILSVVIAVFVVFSCFTLSMSAAVQDEWATYDWIPDYDFVAGLREFTSYPGYYRNNVDDYSIGGTWRFASHERLKELYIKIPDDVPTNVYRPAFLLTRYDTNPEVAPALTVAFGDEYVTGGIALVGFREDLDPPDPYMYLQQIQVYDYVRNEVFVIWDRDSGFNNSNYNNVSFGHGAVDPQISPIAFQLLVESGVMSPVDVSYGDGGDGFIDFTSWLAVAVGGFFSFSLFNGFTIGHMIGALVAFSFVMVFLKFFAGG